MFDSNAADLQDDARPTRPDDCDCAEGQLEHGLPCWPCYREGFDLPNPDPEGDD